MIFNSNILFGKFLIKNEFVIKEKNQIGLFIEF